LFNLLNLHFMNHNSDSGHAMNVANFKVLNGYVVGYGESYNPSNNLIKLPAMQEMAEIATGVQGAHTATISPYKNAMAAREIVFSPLSGLVSRAMNILKSSGASKQVYDQVNTIARKIKGQRASKKIKPEPPVEGKEPEPVPKQISASHMGYDSRIANFEIFISMLAGIPEYNPNEGDLKIEALSELLEVLKVKNSDFLEVEVPYSNTRLARNEVFYTSITGLCDVGQSSKNYVKGVFGASSPQFKQISKIQFKKIK
jgi:hypothetical protein